MANNGNGRDASAKKPTDAKTASKNKGKSKNGRSTEARSLIVQIMPFIFYVSAILVLLVLVLNEGFVVIFLQNVLKGLFSFSAFAIPVLLVLLGVFWRSGADGTRVGWKFWCSAVVALFFTVLVHIVVAGNADFSVVDLYNTGIKYESGGVIGGLVGSVFISCFGKIISIVILASVMFVLCLLLFGLTPNTVYHLIKGKAVETRDRRRVRAEETKRIRELTDQAGDDDEDIDALPPPAHGEALLPAGRTQQPSHRRRFDTDVDMSADKRGGDKRAAAKASETDQDAIDAKIFEEVTRRTRERYGEQSFPEQDAADGKNAAADGYEEPSYGEPENTHGKKSKIREFGARKPVRAHDPSKTSLSPVSERNDDGDIDLSKIFVDPDAIELLARSNENSSRLLEAERGTVSDPWDDDAPQSFPDGEAEAPAPEYKFPPLTLLTEPKAASEADISELKETAQRLVDTLASFRVRTKISDIFHGPTITRYELTPDVGTRVSSIANLADDIALNLAAESVRIEAPIPGKSAVGVEVPNRVRETVYLRQLFDTDEFRNAKSLLTAALGCDVAGKPVYCDISKMPHLLIAGTTGGGKSVCINCIIMSILYRTTPEQVRLIMIDPKQVEFVPYNGIPHLHVPVVSDMKKAAGTLSWAVGEMEKRYEMIRDVGMKNIEGYNKITESDPEKPYMPYLVIFIDELADLMMTSSDDVETPICRIAQKGRAAGVHIIIGTQRPSVDVVTGLIKANFPSRIALTSASQTDSRTILGTGGAEKLLGRGDMLYAPIGAPKPLRVQGAYVGEDEVDAVTEFLKGSCPNPGYDEDAIDGIEEAARQCGTSKKGRGDEDGDDGGMGDDPMIRQALELAVDTGKISTSLIQRHLSLGYGRAAKLIDRMEALGYVSAPNGQRPRDVLITRQQFQELVLKDGFNK